MVWSHSSQQDATTLPVHNSSGDPYPPAGASIFARSSLKHCGICCGGAALNACFVLPLLWKSSQYPRRKREGVQVSPHTAEAMARFTPPGPCLTALPAQPWAHGSRALSSAHGSPASRNSLQALPGPQAPAALLCTGAHPGPGLQSSSCSFLCQT